MPFLLPSGLCLFFISHTHCREDTLLVKYALIALSHVVPFVVKLSYLLLSNRKMKDTMLPAWEHKPARNREIWAMGSSLHAAQRTPYSFQISISSISELHFELTCCFPTTTAITHFMLTTVEQAAVTEQHGVVSTLFLLICEKYGAHSVWIQFSFNLTYLSLTSAAAFQVLQSEMETASAGS